MKNHRSRAASTLGTLLFALSLAAGCATSSHSRRVQADRQISLDANAALAQAGLRGARLEARSYHGVVALLGSVGGEADRRRAEAAIARLDGVVRVNNLILVVGEQPEAAAAAPAVGVPLISRASSAPGQ